MPHYALSSRPGPVSVVVGSSCSGRRHYDGHLCPSPRACSRHSLSSYPRRGRYDAARPALTLPRRSYLAGHSDGRVVSHSEGRDERHSKGRYGGHYKGHSAGLEQREAPQPAPPRTRASARHTAGSVGCPTPTASRSTSAGNMDRTTSRPPRARCPARDGGPGVTARY